MKLCADPDTRPEPDALTEALHPELLKTFKPASSAAYWWFRTSIWPTT